MCVCVLCLCDVCCVCLNMCVLTLLNVDVTVSPEYVGLPAQREEANDDAREEAGGHKVELIDATKLRLRRVGKPRTVELNLSVR